MIDVFLSSIVYPLFTVFRSVNRTMPDLAVSERWEVYNDKTKLNGALLDCTF